MEEYTYLSMRNVLMFSIMLSTALLCPESLPDVPRMLLKKLRAYKAQRLTRKTGRAGTAKEKFWEIDLTKFEP